MQHSDSPLQLTHTTALSTTSPWTSLTHSLPLSLSRSLSPSLSRALSVSCSLALSLSRSLSVSRALSLALTDVLFVCAFYTNGNLAQPTPRWHRPIFMAVA